MKRYLLNIFFISFFCFLYQVCTAQIRLTLALNSRPLPYLADWYKPINGQLIIAYFPGQLPPEQSIKLQTTLLDLNGNEIAKSNITSAITYKLLVGINLFTIADALQLQNLIVSGAVQSLLQRSGRLPAGQYQLIVRVLSILGDKIYAEQSRPFFVTAYQLPLLMQPANGASLDARVAQNIITFKWTSVVPAAEQGTRYRVQVFEILAGQTDMQAYRSNRPLLDEEVVRGSTQYIWRSNLPMLDSTANNQFIWTVQTLDEKGQPMPTNDAFTEARSEPAVFTIYKKTHPALPKKNSRG